MEINSLSEAPYSHEEVDYSEGDVPLADERIVRIDRIRLLSDPGFPFWDVSYVWGTLKDGRHVRVDIGIGQIPKGAVKSSLILVARKAGRYAKSLDMLDDSTISKLD